MNKIELQHRCEGLALPSHEVINLLNPTYFGGEQNRRSTYFMYIACSYFLKRKVFLGS